MRAWIFSFSFLALMSCDSGPAAINLELGTEREGPLRAVLESGFLRVERSGRGSELPLDVEELRVSCVAICEKFTECGFSLMEARRCTGECVSDLSETPSCAFPLIETLDCIVDLTCGRLAAFDDSPQVLYSCGAELVELVTTPATPLPGSDVCELGIFDL